jgi:hypothetical protein
MLKKTILGLFAVAAVSVASPDLASARAGMHGGGFHGGGFHRGFGPGLAFGALGLGLGLAAAPYAYGYGYPYYGSYAAYGGCYLVPRRVWTPWGWRLRRVQVCD